MHVLKQKQIKLMFIRSFFYMGFLILIAIKGTLYEFNKESQLEYQYICV